MFSQTLPNRLLPAALLALATVVAFVLIYQVFSPIECHLTDYEAACRGLRGSLIRAVFLLAVLALYLWRKPGAYQGLQKATADGAGPQVWLLVFLCGVVIALVPTALIAPDEMNHAFGTAFAFMSIGAALAGLGLLIWTANPGAWLGWLRDGNYAILAYLTVAALLPELATAIAPLWDGTKLSELTFTLVNNLLVLTGAEVFVEPDSYIIGVDGFVVQVASQCSGIEGVALVLGFMTLYALLMRSDLNMRRYWLVLLPLALMTSWGLNIVRIAVLIMIGAWVSETHALNGFHSFAGWLLFTALALVVVVVAQAIPWFHRKDRVQSKGAPLADDWMALCILPFVVMMVSGVVVSVIWAEPEAGYSLRVAMMLAVLLYFHRALRQMGWRASPLSALAGVVVGVLWVLPTLGSAGPVTAAPYATWVWIALRLSGTILFVPIIEELFFRGYILRRLDEVGGLSMRLLALAVSSGLFALMHEAWALATLAGLVFGLLMLWRGRLADAVLAHVAANATVAIWAVYSGNWSAI